MLSQLDWTAEMSWIQKLYETYDQCIGAPQFASNPLPPIGHTTQQAHIEISLDGNGNFRRAYAINKENTVIPATEKSATARTSAVVPHPLCDHVKYCAGDYLEGGEAENKYFVKYREQLRGWSHFHPKAAAILNYIEKKTVLKDLVREKVMPVDDGGRLLRKWDSKKDKPFLLRQLTQDSATKEYKPQNALIRWRVEIAGDPVPEVWKDKKLQDAWHACCTASEVFKTPDLCMVTGRSGALADKHPNKIRHGKDGAKLISNKKDTDSDFVYLGRFLKVEQAAGVGIEISQKAHGALRWLVERQGFRNGDQTIVTWEVGGKEIPDPCSSTATLFGIDTDEGDTAPQYQGDAGQSYARRLNNCIRGYRTKLGSGGDIVVMGLDSATAGRMAITYYRELTGSEFFDRIQAWHESFAWHQNYGRDVTTKRIVRFVGAPSPKDIAEAAYGRQIEGKSGEKLRKATVERLLPCIIDGRPMPRDLVESVVRRTCNRTTFKKDKKGGEWEWEKNLGIACAVFRGHHNEEEYQMTLEHERKSRDYLFGRLLAVADRIEDYALYLADEKRDTNAARLMQRFADRPYSTWRTIELSLSPYMSRLRSKSHIFLREKNALLDELVCDLGENFTNDKPLSGEFLLGFHCQRQALRPPPKPKLEVAKETIDRQTNEGAT